METNDIIRPKVFLIEELRSTSLDLSTADKFGDLELAFTVDERRASVFDERFQVELVDMLERRGFDPFKDYLLCAGSMIVVLMSATAMLRKWGTIKTLIFHNGACSYVERVLSTNGGTR